MKRLIVIALIALAAILPGFAVTHGPVAVRHAVAYEANCTYGGFYPSFGTSASSTGEWVQCSTNAGGGRVRTSQVCWYVDGRYLGCRTYSSASAYFENWMTVSTYRTVAQHRWQAWYYFRDQYGASASVWGGNIYANYTH